MNKVVSLLIVGLIQVTLALPASAQTTKSFDEAAASIQKRLEDSIAELNALRAQGAETTIPLSRELNEAENELANVRREYQDISRNLDASILEMNNLRHDVDSRTQQSGYLSNLLGEYMRNFESRLHVAELQRYKAELEEANLAAENSNLSDEEVFQVQATLLDLSLERLEESLAGTVFEGTAVNTESRVKPGTFLIVGPAAVFRSVDGVDIGSAEQRLGSLEPAIIPFALPENTAAVDQLISSSTGFFPLDPTLGNAHKIEETEETLLEHVKKGGAVMYPLFALAAISFLLAGLKWLGMGFVRIPSRKRIKSFLDAVGKRDTPEIQKQLARINRGAFHPIKDWIQGAMAGALLGSLIYWITGQEFAVNRGIVFPGSDNLGLIVSACAAIGGLIEFMLHRVIRHTPIGQMLSVGVEHLNEPTELIEEVMYESVLSTRLRLERFLSFIAITAAAAPLLGLLGTVTGIINTFKLITVFGTGDVKTLSGGISEALITTEYGLIVAIPSLLMHALLSRKTKGIINEMERTGVSFVNQVAKSYGKLDKSSDTSSNIKSNGNPHPPSDRSASISTNHDSDVHGTTTLLDADPVSVN